MKQPNRENAKAISPLRRLLMNSSVDGLLDFLHQMNVQYVLKRDPNGHYDMKIFRDGMMRYQAASGKSAKSAVADALAQFLVGEQKDFHGYFQKDDLDASSKVM
jgi:hypothetical protein